MVGGGASATGGGLGEVMLLKLGGSLITDKLSPGTPRLEVLERLAGELVEGLGAIDERVLVGHGSGSFGHAEAVLHGIIGGCLDDAGRRGASLTQARAAELDALVLDALRDAGATPLPFPPSATVIADRGRPTSMSCDSLLEALNQGFLPVTYGDLVPDRSWGASILSTETILATLVPQLRRRGYTIRRALWFGATDGVLDKDGCVVEEIGPSNLEEILHTARGAAGVDVTGGIRHRIEIVMDLATQGITSLLVDGTVDGNLAHALRGEEVGGTRING